MAFTRREIRIVAVVAAVCVGLFIGGNHDPQLLGILVVAAIVIAGDSWLRRRWR